MNKYWSIKQLAYAVGRRESTIRDWISRGALTKKQKSKFCEVRIPEGDARRVLSIVKGKKYVKIRDLIPNTLVNT